MEELKPEPVLGRALMVDRARRASAARAIAVVFCVTLLLTTLGLLRAERATPSFVLIQLVTTLAFGVSAWLARTPEGASRAGATLVIAQLAQQVGLTFVLDDPQRVINTAYFTAFIPLVAAATLRARGTIISGIAASLVFAFHIVWLSRGEVALEQVFIAPGAFFVAAWAIGTFYSLASNRALEEHAAQERNLSLALEATRRMEALGRLAGGVAHDFNNLILVIQSCAEFVAGALGRNHPSRPDLETVFDATRRATSLTNQLLTFSRRQVLSSQERTLASRTVSEFVPILQRICGTNIRFDLEMNDSCCEVNTSPVQLEQILMNLTTNARDSMPRGGKLTVTLRDHTLQASEVAALPPGRYLELAVSDTGTGMTPDVQARLFEPFFTTKPFGKGTGLGLSTVFGLVSQLRGHVAVHSVMGEGTTFTLWLPEAPPESRQSEEPAAPPSEDAQTPLDVLVVDDEADVRALVARILSSAGHRVTDVASAEEAVRTVEAPNTHFDAVVTDVVLGSEDGVSMLERLASATRGAAIVVVSGFSPSPERVAEITRRRAEFLPKPFGAAELLSALSRARTRRLG